MEMASFAVTGLLGFWSFDGINFSRKAWNLRTHEELITDARLDRKFDGYNFEGLGLRVRLCADKEN